MTRLMPCAIVLSGGFLTACATSTTPAIATETRTEAETCRQLGAHLPTRSRSDTEQTRAEIQALYAAFALICPNWAHLIPQPKP